MPRPARPRVRTALLLGVLLLTAPACAPADPAPAAAPVPTLAPPELPTPPPDAPADTAAALPLAAYRHAPAEQALVNSARDTLVAACMTRLGHPGWRPPAPPSAAGEPWVSGMAIGLLDAGHAAAYGYHAPAAPERTEDRPLAERIAYSGPLPGETAEGVPEGGCAEEGQRAFDAGRTLPDLELVADLAAQAENAVAADPRAAAALTAWSECMRAKGHEYPGPGAAPYQYWAEQPTDVEKNLAVADVACKDDVGLGGVWFALLSGYQQRLADAHVGELGAVRAALDAEVAYARGVLGEA